ncbi:MAG: head decoration protein [Rhodospirillales bacterium]|nr:head decoration protein [Rhodospirillales bacterium]
MSVASFDSQGSFAHDRLLGGDFPRIVRKGTLLSGENRPRGALLGRILLGAATVAATAGNTGNGVFTLDALTPVLANAQAGVYAIRCIAAATNSGTFRVSDPKGNVIGDVAVGATFANQIKFSIADGSSDFAVGDGFNVTIAAGSGKYRLSVAAALDGSQYPSAVLVEAVDASAGDRDALVYLSGEFADAAITFAAGHTADSVRTALRLLGIHLATSLAP